MKFHAKEQKRKNKIKKKKKRERTVWQSLINGERARNRITDDVSGNQSPIRVRSFSAQVSPQRRLLFTMPILSARI